MRKHPPERIPRVWLAKHLLKRWGVWPVGTVCSFRNMDLKWDYPGGICGELSYYNLDPHELHKIPKMFLLVFYTSRNTDNLD